MQHCWWQISFIYDARWFQNLLTLQTSNKKSPSFISSTKTSCDSNLVWLCSMEGHLGQKCNWIVTSIPLDRSACYLFVSFMPFDRTRIPVDRTSMPVDRTRLPFDRTRMAFDRTSMPFDRTRMSFDCISILLDRTACYLFVIFMPVDRIRMPFDRTSMPFDRTPLWIVNSFRS